MTETNIETNAIAATDLLVFLMRGETIKKKDHDKVFDVFRGIVAGMFVMLCKIEVNLTGIMDKLIKYYEKMGSDEEATCRLYRSLRIYAQAFEDDQIPKNVSDVVGPTFSLMLSLFPLVLEGIEDEKAFENKESELQLLCCLVFPIAARATSVEHASAVTYERTERFVKEVIKAGNFVDFPSVRLPLKGPEAVFDAKFLPDKYKSMGKYEDDEYYYPPGSLN